VPIVTHLDQIAGSGIYQRYPELKGKGKKAQSAWGPEVFAPCFSQPKTAEILADWFVSLAATPGVEDICVWLSEDHVQCECEGCQAKGQFALEAEACVRAWKLARQKNPKVRLRILSRHRGGLCAPGAGRFCFAAKRESPDNRFYDFNVTAAAEWSWNAQGSCFAAKRKRSEREFALAWATRRRLSDPEKAADWATMRAIGGKVGWDVYGSGIPYPQFFGRTADLIRKRACLIRE